MSWVNEDFELVTYTIEKRVGRRRHFHSRLDRAKRLFGHRSVFHQLCFLSQTLQDDFDEIRESAHVGLAQGLSNFAGEAQYLLRNDCSAGDTGRGASVRKGFVRIKNENAFGIHRKPFRKSIHMRRRRPLLVIVVEMTLAA